MRVGDVVLVHDNTAWVNWKLAVIESLNLGGDGKICSANIQTTNGSINWLIASLYLLEVNSTEICTTYYILQLLQSHIVYTELLQADLLVK